MHLLLPSHQDARIILQSGLSMVTKSSVGDSPFLHRDIVSLKMCDELCAFELHRGPEGDWYSDHVVCTIRRLAGKPDRGGVEAGGGPPGVHRHLSGLAHLL